MHHQVVIVITFLAHRNSNNPLLIRKNIWSRTYSVRKRKQMSQQLLQSETIHVSSWFFENIFRLNRPTRNTGSNIFGTDSEQSNIKSGTIAGQFKQTQMKSNIFGSDEPTSSRPVSDKNKSDIFGVNDKNEQNKQSSVRQGLRGKRHCQ